MTFWTLFLVVSLMKFREYPVSPMIFQENRKRPSSGSSADLALAGIGKQLLSFFHGINHGIAALNISTALQDHAVHVAPVMVLLTKFKSHWIRRPKGHDLIHITSLPGWHSCLFSDF